MPQCLDYKREKYVVRPKHKEILEQEPKEREKTTTTKKSQKKCPSVMSGGSQKPVWEREL